jgi:histidinol-phosphatase (PHP family)
MIDQHTHTTESPDASDNATIDNYLEKANALNIAGLTFTDHVDFDSPVALFHTLPNFKKLFKAKETLNQRSDFCYFAIGVELGWQPDSEPKMRTLTKTYPFDCVIMSLHVGDSLDFHNGDFFNEYGHERAIIRYFELVLKSLETYHDFDVYGHIDYISRYVPSKIKTYGFSAHKAIIDKILKKLIALDKAIEINTSAWKYGLEDFHPRFEVLKRYYELGGRKITLGSDAHAPAHLTKDFDKALVQLKDIGFKYLCHFKHRKCKRVKIS